MFMHGAAITPIHAVPKREDINYSAGELRLQNLCTGTQVSRPGTQCASKKIGERELQRTEKADLRPGKWIVRRCGEHHNNLPTSLFIKKKLAAKFVFVKWEH